MITSTPPSHEFRATRLASSRWLLLACIVALIAGRAVAADEFFEPPIAPPPTGFNCWWGGDYLGNDNVSNVSPARSGAVFTVSSTRSVTALEGWVSAAPDGTYYPNCCLSDGGGFRYSLAERTPPSAQWTTIAWTAEHGELTCDTVLLPNGLYTCCEPPVPTPIPLAVETCAEMLVGREYKFVYEAVTRPVYYRNVVAPLTAAGGYPYHVITGGGSCGSACTGTASPQGGCLELLVDADGDGQDDRSWYVPEGADPANATGRTIHLVARYTPASAAAGKVARFALTDTSRFPGECENYRSFAVSESAPDLSIIGSREAIFGGDGRAVIDVRVTDWGGWTRARVDVSDLGTGTAITIPKDDPVNPDYIADVQWAVLDDTGATTPVNGASLIACADTDASPPSPGWVTPTGDGFRAIAEYRGFMAGGAHVRTDPTRKDVFIRVDWDGVTPMPVTLNLPTTEHWLTAAEAIHAGQMDPYRHSDAVCGARILHQEHVVVVVDGSVLLANSDEWGDTVSSDPLACNPPQPAPQTMHGCCPLNVSLSVVYAAKIRTSSPPNASPVARDGPDDQSILFTLRHELGHQLGVDHYDFGQHGEMCAPSPTCAPRSAMCQHPVFWLRPQASSGNPPFWTNFPAGHDNQDGGELRLLPENWR